MKTGSAKPERQAVAAQYMWAVHVTSLRGPLDQVTEVQPIETVFSNEQAACEEACACSRNYGVVEASVTRFQVDHLSARNRVALYVDGTRQQLPHFTDEPRRYVAG